MPLNRRDNNEADILDLWKALGCHWIPQPRQNGFDLVLIARNGAHIVEIKNPARKWELTEAEQRRKAKVEAAGGTYHIIQTYDDARRLVGL